MTGAKWLTQNGDFQGHLGTANYLFADGHVKALRPIATASTINMWGQMNANTASDGGACADTTKRDINCDVSPQSLKDALAALDKKFNP